MATVHPGTATPASTISAPPDSTGTIVCPLCQSVTACTLASDRTLQQLPCPSCAGNLIVLNPETRPTDEEVVGQPDDHLGSIDLSRRITGIAVATLTFLLNFVLLSGTAYWMLSQIKATHDPYDVDELMVSPLILRSNGWTPLHLAAARGDLAAATALLGEEASIDRRNGKGRTALYEAAKRGQTEMVTLLLRHGADPNTRAKQGFTPLLAASERGHADTIALLLSKGADLKATCICGDSALHRAVRQGHLAAAQTLLEQGINVNRKTHGQTALEIARENEDQALIDLLQAHGGKEFSQAKAEREQGMAFQKLGQLDKALFAYAAALNLDPDYPEAYYSRGTALIQKEAYDEALIAFQAAMQLDPTLIEAYSASSRIYAERRQWDLAMALWDRFLAHQPQNGRAHFERSVLRRAQGDSQGFLQDLRQACAFGHQPAC